MAFLRETGGGFIGREDGGYILREDDTGLPGGMVVQGKRVIKPKRRQFTFPNGITVWATDESLARAMAGLGDLPPTGPEDVPAITDERLEADEGESVAESPTRTPDARPEADFKADTARLNTVELRRRREAAVAAQAKLAEAAVAAQIAQAKRLQRRRAEEEQIIMHLLMDEMA